jgi:hypothetical protein
LDRALIELQFPQNSIWYEGELVGYFTNTWTAPIWTTPFIALPPAFENVYDLERETSPPITHPQIPQIPVTPPTPPTDPEDDVPPIIDPVIVTAVPEPGFLSLLPMLIPFGAAVAFRRRLRNRRDAQLDPERNRRIKTSDA